MSCFNHPTANAVGVCKHCGRNLCHDCLSDELDSVACKTRCVDKVKAIDAFMHKAVLAKFNPTLIANLVGALLLAILSTVFWLMPELELYGKLIAGLSIVLFINTLRSYLKR